MRRALITLTLSLAPLVPSQMAGTNSAVGYVVRKSGSTYTGMIGAQLIDGRCGTNIVPCFPVGSPVDLLGGTAYDARHQSVWVAYGTTIEEHQLVPCRTLVKFTPALLNASGRVTGLAVADRHRRLYHLETTAGTLGIRSYDLKTSPPQPLTGSYTTPLTGVNPVAGGIAYDEVRDRLYVAVSFAAFHGFMTEIHVLRLGATTTLMGKMAVPMPAGTGGPQPVTGVGYDAHTRRLYATDGTLTLAGTVIDPDKGTVQWSTTTCPRTQSGVWVGMAVLPGWTKSFPGSSCLGTPCSPCPAMRWDTAGGDPVLGNEAFGFVVDQAPLSASVFLLLGGGPCTSGLQLPLLCGPLYPSFTPPPILVAAGSTRGTSTCGGSAFAPVPIPVDPVLPGARFCAQWILGCTGSAGVGLGVTGAVEFSIAGG